MILITIFILLLINFIFSFYHKHTKYTIIEDVETFSLFIPRVCKVDVYTRRREELILFKSFHQFIQFNFLFYYHLMVDNRWKDKS